MLNTGCYELINPDTMPGIPSTFGKRVLRLHNQCWLIKTYLCGNMERVLVTTDEILNRGLTKIGLRESRYGFPGGALEGGET